MRRIAQTVTIAAAVALAAGCVEREPTGGQPAPPDPAYVERNLFAELPEGETLTHRLDADIGGKVVYLGNQIDRTAIVPGEPFTIVHWWKVVSPPGPDWRVFTHVIGASPAEWMNVDYTPMRAGHGPDKWQAGQVIRDEQKIALKGDWRSPTARIAVGLWRRGAQGVDGRMPVSSGPVDAERRLIVATLPVQLKGQPSLPTYAIRRARGPIEIDGKPDDAAWAAAPWSPDFAPTIGGEPLRDRTRAKLLWDDQHLYAFVEVTDRDVFSEFRDRDGTLWKADVVEWFIDADGNRRGYVELQVNPHNAHFDAWFAKTRREGSDVAWNAGMRSAVRVRGTVDDRSDVDEGWDVEVAIPLVAVRGRDDAMRVTIPPRVGDRWRLNIVRVDKPKDAGLRASSWSRIPIQDFHALDRLATVVFADADGQTAAARAVGARAAATAAPAEAGGAATAAGDEPRAVKPAGGAKPRTTRPVEAR
ncbi:MAG: hypothetical protein D6689_06240 [Deltaproteobacteria bacterium]|nr:MAG: hypothetical protein D6689_06240 [Deltaproteobacteria bacterium]